MDETWVHHFTPETKKQSKQWTERGKSAPKKAKTVPCAGKVMANNEEVESAVNGYFEELDGSPYKQGIEAI